MHKRRKRCTTILPFILMALTSVTFGQAVREKLPPTDGPPLKVKIALAGDSTVTDVSGWGAAFKKLLTPEGVCLNHARSGRSSRSYRDEGHWSKLLETHPDYILIQFGHNDQPGKGPQRETDPRTTFREFLGRYVDEARAIGAKPVLVTPLTRRSFAGKKLADSGLSGYAEAVRAVGLAKEAPVLDLNARSREAIEPLGQAAADRLGPIGKDGKPDRTHLNAEGARLAAELVGREIERALPELAPLVTPKLRSAK